MLSKGVFLLSLSFQFLLVLSDPLYLGTTPSSSDEDLSDSYDWKAGYTREFKLHSSCNATQRHELRRGLSDAVTLANHAREHILIQGTDSPIYKKYFGQGPTGAVLGWYDKIGASNRKNIVFRCDDPDRNCRTQNQWAGHHRGNNASSETVICELSFQTRLPLEALCARGFDIATGKTNRYWGLDLIHRLYHIDQIGEDSIKHRTHGYKGALKLAAGKDYKLAATNTDSLILFAAEAYAFDISNPGIGCAGNVPRKFRSNSRTKSNFAKHEHKHKKAHSDETGGECHTHSDGSVHCH